MRVTLCSVFLLCLASLKFSGIVAGDDPPFEYSAVDLGEYCKRTDVYCIYVDQRYRSIIKVTRASAFDRQGGFLFEKSRLGSQPISLQYGGCGIQIRFVDGGCVKMDYAEVPTGQSGHLLGFFANNPTLKVGPKQTMPKSITACPQANEPVPYAVIQVRQRRGFAGRPGGEIPGQGADPTTPNTPDGPDDTSVEKKPADEMGRNGTAATSDAQPGAQSSTVFASSTDVTT